MNILKSISNLLNSGAEGANSTANYLFSTAQAAFHVMDEVMPSTGEILVAHAIDAFTSSDDSEDSLVDIIMLPATIAAVGGMVIGAVGCGFYVSSKLFEAEKMLVDYIDSKLEDSTISEAIIDAFAMEMALSIEV